MDDHPNPAYPHWDTITTRWMDNDMYGHVNNVQYYSFFDTVVTTWLVRQGGLDPAHGEVIGLCVESQCTFAAPLSFPDQVLAGLRVGHIGRSSVRYEIELYAAGSREPAASGHFVHVYVDRESRRPTAVPAPLREALAALT
jgi:acyl-CoA thioester hydrolase